MNGVRSDDFGMLNQRPPQTEVQDRHLSDTIYPPLGFVSHDTSGISPPFPPFFSHANSLGASQSRTCTSWGAQGKLAKGMPNKDRDNFQLLKDFLGPSLTDFRQGEVTSGGTWRIPQTVHRASLGKLSTWGCAGDDRAAECEVPGTVPEAAEEGSGCEAGTLEVRCLYAGLLAAIWPR